MLISPKSPPGSRLSPVEQTAARAPFAHVNLRFLLLICFLSGAWPAVARAIAPPLASVPSDSTLVWEPGRRLTWADFRGTPGPAEGLHALTSTNISVQVRCTDDVLTVAVQAVFRPLESWTKSPDSAPLLRHEQAHFDLTELHARLLRRTLGQLKMTCKQAQTQLQLLIDAAFANWQKAQDRYDDEARHGLDQPEQARWEKQIADQLRATAK